MEQGYNEVQAAAFLGLAVQTLRNYRVFSGKGPVYHKIGSRIIYRMADLEKYFAEHRIDPGARREG